MKSYLHNKMNIFIPLVLGKRVGQSSPPFHHSMVSPPPPRPLNWKHSSAAYNPIICHPLKP